VTAPPPAPTTVDLLVVLTRLETKMDAAVTTSTDHETRIRTLEQAAVTHEEIAPVKSDVESLKRGRWPLPAIGALAGVGGAVIAAMDLLKH
jgi:hypothetical protein